MKKKLHTTPRKMAPRSPPVQSRRETRERPAQKCGNSIVSLFPALGHWNLASFCSVGRYACAMTFCSLSSRSQRLSSFVWLTFNFKSLLRAPADRSTTIARLSHESAAEAWFDRAKSGESEMMITAGLDDEFGMSLARRAILTLLILLRFLNHNPHGLFTSCCWRLRTTVTTPEKVECKE